jgi:sugar phosphate isomerase/epimerase
MKIGFLTACLPGENLKDIVSWAAKNGFSSLEVACWPSGEGRERLYAGTHHIDVEKLDSRKAAAIRRLFEENGLSISALAYYPNNLDPDLNRRKFYHGHLKKTIEAAALLGVGLVGTFAGRVPELTVEENLDLFEQVFPPLVEHARGCGVGLMLENCPMMYTWPSGTNLAFSPDIWHRIFRTAAGKNLGLNYDPSHLLWQSIDYINPVFRFAGKIFHVHAKDAEILPHRLSECGIYGHGWWRYRLPGLGFINWNAFISALNETGYQGVVSIEHEDPVWEGTPEKVKKGLLMARSHLERFIS